MSDHRPRRRPPAHEPAGGRRRQRKGPMGRCGRCEGRHVQNRAIRGNESGVDRYRRHGCGAGSVLRAGVGASVDDTPFPVASRSVSERQDGVDDAVVRALTYPVAPVDGSRARLRTMELGDLRVALGTGALRFALSLVDGSGRMSGRSVFEYLHWSAGEKLAGTLGKSYLVLR